MRLLAGGLLLGGAARLLSWALAGTPGTLTIVQTGVEIVIPLVVITLLTLSRPALRRDP